MARQFGDYSTAWPLGTTIEEQFLFEDEDGNPVDLTDCEVRMQIRAAEPVRNPATGQASTAPIIELTSDLGLYPPGFDDWTLHECIRIGADPDDPDPTDGTIVLTLPVDDTWPLSPRNEKAKLVFDIEIINTDTDTVIPLLRGKITVLPRRTLQVPT
jgi:hypothetical protein